MENSAKASPSVFHQLQASLAEKTISAIPFSEVMAHALYGPGGYYRKGILPTGQKGDFITSVSVGNLFGSLLARHAHEVWLALEKPKVFSLVEQGASDGQLMSDLLEAAEQLDRDFSAAILPVIIEPFPENRSLQRDKFGSNLTIVTSLSALPQDFPHGLFYNNELLDAFPIHRIRRSPDGSWEEWHLTEEGFRWLPPSSQQIADTAEELCGSSKLPEGYETELHLHLSDWIHEIASSSFRGQITLFDYGFVEDDYYHPDRRCGTLQAYRNHQAIDIQPELLGEIDITSHVNFSLAVRAALSSGLKPNGFESQGSFLTRLASNLLLEIEANPTPVEDSANLVRQFQSLTHPGFMGSKFHVLGLSHGDRTFSNLTGFRPDSIAKHFQSPHA